jgi:hypothetical protein
MRRREFITLFGAVAAAVHFAAARAQGATRMRKIGILMTSRRTIRKVRRE